MSKLLWHTSRCPDPEYYAGSVLPSRFVCGVADNVLLFRFHADPRRYMHSQ